MDQRFRVGESTVDPQLGTIARNGSQIRARAKVIDLLVYFAQHPGRVVTKDELLDRVWRTDAISESALTSTIAELRQALGDDAEAPTILETIPKRGYRLIAPVRSSELAPSASAPRSTRRRLWGY